jgi:hypothetical protein
MTGAKMSDLLREIGWEPATLAQKLGVRVDMVRGWLTSRREIPPNLADWLRRVRDAQASAGPVPEDWR